MSTKNQTMDGFILEPTKKAKKSKPVAKQIPVTDEPDTTLDVAWTVFAGILILVWRLVKWAARHIVGIAATAFVVENLLLLQHLTHFSFK